MRKTQHITAVKILCAITFVALTSCVSADKQARNVTEPARAATVWTSVPKLPAAPSVLAHATMASISAADRARVQAAQAKAAWVGRLHNALLADVYSARGRWGTLSPQTRDADCRIAYQAMLNHVDDVTNGVGHTLDDSRVKVTIRDVIGHMRMCQGISALSIWGSPFGAIGGSVQDEEVSDLGFSYGEVVHQAVLATDGYPGNVYPAVNDVLATAASQGLSSADLEYIAGVGSLAGSSADYWAGVQSGGGELPPIEPMSVFARKRHNPIIGIVAVDVVGCLIGAASAYGGGERNAKRLWGQCGLWGFGGSLGTLAAM
jgi:hypothetical protein